MPHTTKAGNITRREADIKNIEYCRQFRTMRGECATRSEAYGFVRRLGYTKGLRALEHQCKQLDATGHTLVLDRKYGPRPTLGDEEMKSLESWISHKNRLNEPFDAFDLIKQVRSDFDKDISLRVAYSALRQLRQTLKECGGKTTGFTEEKEQLVETYMGFVSGLKKENFLFTEPENIRSMDATYTAKPVKPETTFSRIGSGRQWSKTKRLPNTNTIVTMISADGKNHTPCEMWSSAPRFARFDGDVQPTPARAVKYEYLLDRCKFYGIGPKRIHFVKDGKAFTGETPEIYMEFLKDVDRNARIFHDGGNAFKPKGVSIFDTLGFKYHRQYPPSVHQYMSPNDFHLHGCKSTWYREYANFPDDVCATLRLMQLIDIDTIAHSKTYFQKNILCVKKSNVKRVVGM